MMNTAIYTYHQELSRVLSISAESSGSLTE